MVCPKQVAELGGSALQAEEVGGREEGQWRDNGKVGGRNAAEPLSFIQQPFLERDVMAVSADFQSPSLLPTQRSPEKGGSLSFRHPVPRLAASDTPGGEPKAFCFISALSQDRNCSQVAWGRKHPPLNHSLPLDLGLFHFQVSFGDGTSPKEVQHLLESRP